MFTMFIVTLMARLVGDAVWHFLQLWMVGQNWYQNICMKISCGLTKKVVKQFEEEEL